MAGRLMCLLLVVGFQTVLCQRVCDWKTCRECIRDPNVCMWCATEEFNGTSRCKPVTHAEKNWCPLEDIQNPLNDITETESKDFSSEIGDMVQIKPHRYHIALRVGQEQKFSFSFKASESFPVDIYFLLDASITMTVIRDDLVHQTRNIYKTMSQFTSNVKIGLGTFIDKNLVPFSRNVSANNSYSFKHQLSLTRDKTYFLNALNNYPLGSSTDAPESGLEGIAQAIACKKEINWRNQSRKILVYMTDDVYHSAGDGKAAGIVKPYDGGCYLDEFGFYSKEKEMDYPSVEIINYLAQRDEVKIVFVSNYPDQRVYRKLSAAVRDSKFVQYRPSHISNVLQEIYKEMVERVVLSVNVENQLVPKNNHLDIAFEPNCDEIDCKLTRYREEMNFTGTIKLKKYFKKDRLTIGINPKGLKEKLVLDVDVLSDCGCSKHVEVNSARCDNIGNWSCGVCECPDGRFGPTCECQGNSSHCSPPNSDRVCSDHGLCNSCGNCDCADGYEGTYCEDQNNNCPRGDHDILCSGHGGCLNGKCSCIDGWTGPACESTTSNKNCMNVQVQVDVQIQVHF